MSECLLLEHKDGRVAHVRRRALFIALLFFGDLGSTRAVLYKTRTHHPSGIAQVA